MPLLGPTEDIAGAEYSGLGYLEAARQPRSTAYLAEASQAIETMSTSVGIAAGVKAFMGGPKISRDEALARVKDARVDVGEINEDGISERALDLLIRRQERIRRRETLINSSAMTGVERFGVSMAVGMGDPVNLLTLPMFGAGAWADAAVTGLGRAGRRLAVGAASGAATTAAVEPFYAYGANYIGDDYGLIDSLANIAMGAAAGGALHIGAGLLGDAMRNPVERRAAVPAAMAQAAADQRIDVASLAREVARGDTETRIAREQEDGFTIDAFHGTNQEIDNFDMARAGERMQDAGGAGEALYFSDNPKVASAFAEHALVGEPTFTQNVKRTLSSGKEVTIPNQVAEGANVLPVKLKMKNPLTVDMKGGSYDPAIYRASFDQARAEGRDGVVFKNVNEQLGGHGDVYAVFDAGQIRNRFQAPDTIPPPDTADLASRPTGTAFDTPESRKELENVNAIANISESQRSQTQSVRETAPGEPVNTAQVAADDDLIRRTNEDLADAKQTADALESKELENDMTEANQDVKDTDEFAKAYAAALDCGRRKGI